MRGIESEGSLNGDRGDFLSFFGRGGESVERFDGSWDGDLMMRWI